MASEVKHLYMKVEFTGDSETLLPFPEIDFVDFFNSHPKLQTFDIHGAMFAAICQKNSLRNVSPCKTKELSRVMFANPVSCSNECLSTRFAGGLEVSDTLPREGCCHSEISTECWTEDEYLGFVDQVRKEFKEDDNKDSSDEEQP